jgi:hypothetical protein
MSQHAPQPLNYRGIAPEERPEINIPAAISLGCAIASAVFVLSMLVGIWNMILPAIARNAGWLTGALSLIAIINGALGALQADKESPWYRAALFGYALGLFVACVTPVFFLT